MLHKNDLNNSDACLLHFTSFRERNEGLEISVSRVAS